MYIPIGGTAGHMVDLLMFFFLRNFQTNFQSNCTSLYSHQESSSFRISILACSVIPNDGSSERSEMKY